MIYMKGNPHDFDEWASLGNKGWSYKDCLPYFENLDQMMSPEGAGHTTILRDDFSESWGIHGLSGCG